MRRLLLFCLVGIGLLGCEPEKGCTDPTALNFNESAGLDDGSCKGLTDPLPISQDVYNLTSFPFVTGITGDTFAGPELTVPHILTETDTIVSTLMTERGIWTNQPFFRQQVADRSIPVGTIVVKRLWYRDATVTAPSPAGRIARRNTYAMIKQPAGYNPEGGDWEYIAFKFEPQTNFSTFPNGVLGSALLRGRVELCMNCHGKDTDGDFLFGD
jgi:Cytochrome P460